MTTEMRDGEIALPFDPATLPPDGHVVFIGRIRSPWTSREQCPKNMGAARERQAHATVEVDPPYRDGLAGLEGTTHLALLTWLDRAPRNLIVQNPRHAGTPKGVFALRSPARPNPVGLHIVTIVSLDREAGLIELDGIDVLDGTPLIDIKPYFATVDSVADATVGWKERAQEK
jgi:tRNA (adenine37-N6)-methyltransferase